MGRKFNEILSFFRLMYSFRLGFSHLPGPLSCYSLLTPLVNLSSIPFHVISSHFSLRVERERAAEVSWKTCDKLRRRKSLKFHWSISHVLWRSKQGVLSHQNCCCRQLSAQLFLITEMCISPRAPEASMTKFTEDFPVFSLHVLAVCDYWEGK